MTKKIIFILFFLSAFLGVQSQSLPIEGKWKIKLTDNLGYSAMEFDDSNWPEIIVDESWSKQEIPVIVAYGWSL